jgi:hypothetical protein
VNFLPNGVGAKKHLVNFLPNGVGSKKHLVNFLFVNIERKKREKDTKRSWWAIYQKTRWAVAPVES